MERAMFLRIFISAVALLSMSMSGFSEAGGRPTRSDEEIVQMRERGTAIKLRKWSNRLPSLFGPSEGSIVGTRFPEKACYIGTSGEKYYCHEFVSNYDQTRWTIAFGTENGYQRIRVLKERNGRMQPYAMIKIVDRSMKDEVIIQSDEVARYAGSQSPPRGGQPARNDDRENRDENPLDKAAGELQRSLGTNVPPRLPPIFGR